MAALVERSEYHAFASFTFAATAYYLGTQTELRSGQWYDGVIKSAPQLAMSFADEQQVTQATNVDLEIGDGASGTYRALAVGNILDGTQVTVSLVMRQFLSNGTTTEQVYTQILTVCGVSLQPAQVTLHLQDIEEQRLQTLYPPNTWQSTDWPELSSDDAGKPICEPVGTALKLPAVLLRSDAANNEYWYGVCTGAPKLIGISSINSGTKTITLASAPRYALAAGQVLIITGSSAADGRYTVASASGTTIVVNETLPTSTGGNVRLMPQVLTVYRNKRVVSASEYTVQQCNFPGALTNGDFTAGSSGWTVGTGGGGTVTFAPNACTLSASGGVSYAYINQALSSTMKAVFYAVQVTTGAGGNVGVNVAGAARSTDKIIPPNSTQTVFLTLLPPYSGSVACAPQNYSGMCVVKSLRVIPLELTVLKFAQPQIDFNGSNYTIECDCAGVESQNASTEIQRLLGNVGATTDSVTFNAAAGQSFAQLVDCDYGRSGQRRVDAILDDLLPVARAGLSRNSAGAYTIWQDVAGTPALTMDESAGDPVNVTRFDCVAQPLTVGLNYAPSSADANQMQVQMTRPVTGGILAAESPREIRYLRDASTADALLCYRALRRWRGRKATAAIYGTQVNIGDKVSLTSPRNWSGAKTFTVWEVQRVASGNQLTLLEYDAAVYTYTAGTLPPNAPTGYQADYSFTPPLAPSALAITATAARVANDGTTTSYATVQATPPAVNWAQMWFAAIHNVTGEIALATGASIGGGNYGATIGPLRPGEVYRLQCYAVNSNNLQGVVQSTFNATAIGGGGAVTTFTTAGQATLPPNVASCNAAQVMGSNIQVYWPAVSGKNIKQYVLERKQGAGAFAQCYAGLATSWTDTGVSYTDGSYIYQVRAQDTYGNYSAAYATSGSVTAVGNVYGGSGGDIGSSTVATVNRTTVTTVSASVGNFGGFTQASATHSLGKIPVCGAVSISGMGVGSWATINGTSTTTINFNAFTYINNPTSTTVVNALGTSHSHNINFGGMLGGSVNVDIW